ncbi:uncharacterized protein LOC106666115 isoform X2 [Cimex lectularius]|uniref:Transforming acidic coiled-coil-containing protein C-terminal domain-containing protein n=1 Tax=Cimex lectularius TaxID=79782 RepID=A0A8I6SNK4_CIMLE|nr:uncharacterized protein LOC106666115 isoform X2 [Cimex lectularius]
MSFFSFFEYIKQMVKIIFYPKLTFGSPELQSGGGEKVKPEAILGETFTHPVEEDQQSTNSAASSPSKSHTDVDTTDYESADEGNVSLNPLSITTLADYLDSVHIGTPKKVSPLVGTFPFSPAEKDLYISSPKSADNSSRTLELSTTTLGDEDLESSRAINANITLINTDTNALSCDITEESINNDSEPKSSSCECNQELNEITKETNCSKPKEVLAVDSTPQISTNNVIYDNSDLKANTNFNREIINNSVEPSVYPLVVEKKLLNNTVSLKQEHNVIANENLTNDNNTQLGEINCDKNFLSEIVESQPSEELSATSVELKAPTVHHISQNSDRTVSETSVQCFQRSDESFGEIYLSLNISESDFTSWENETIRAVAESDLKSFERETFQAVEESNIKPIENKAITAEAESDIKPTENKTISAVVKSDIKPIETKTTSAVAQLDIRSIEDKTISAVVGSDIQPIENKTVSAAAESDIKLTENKTISAKAESDIKPIENKTISAVVETDIKPIENKTIITAAEADIKQTKNKTISVKVASDIKPIETKTTSAVVGSDIQPIENKTVSAAAESDIKLTENKTVTAHAESDIKPTENKTIITAAEADIKQTENKTISVEVASDIKPIETKTTSAVVGSDIQPIENKTVSAAAESDIKLTENKTVTAHAESDIKPTENKTIITAAEADIKQTENKTISVEVASDIKPIETKTTSAVAGLDIRLIEDKTTSAVVGSDIQPIENKAVGAAAESDIKLTENKTISAAVESDIKQTENKTLTAEAESDIKPTENKTISAVVGSDIKSVETKTTSAVSEVRESGILQVIDTSTTGKLLNQDIPKLEDSVVDNLTNSTTDTDLLEETIVPCRVKADSIHEKNPLVNEIIKRDIVSFTNSNTDLDICPNNLSCVSSASDCNVTILIKPLTINQADKGAFTISEKNISKSNTEQNLHQIEECEEKLSLKQALEDAEILKPLLYSKIPKQEQNIVNLPQEFTCSHTVDTTDLFKSELTSSTTSSVVREDSLEPASQSRRSSYREDSLERTPNTGIFSKPPYNIMDRSYNGLQELYETCSKQERELGCTDVVEPALFNLSIATEAKRLADEINKMDLSSEYLDDVKPPQCMMQSSLPAEINNSEAGPITADEDFKKSDYFQNATTVFNLEYLSRSHSQRTLKPSNLTRNSLFLKFDPLVGKLVEADEQFNDSAMSDKPNNKPMEPSEVTINNSLVQFEPPVLPEKQLNLLSLLEEPPNERPFELSEIMDEHCLVKLNPNVLKPDSGNKNLSKNVPTDEPLTKTWTPPKDAAGNATLVPITPLSSKNQPSTNSTPNSTKSQGSTPTLRQEFLSKEISKLQELMLQQEAAHQELLLEKTDEVEKLRKRLSELEMREPKHDLEKRLKELQAENARLQKELSESNASNKQLIIVMEEYEKTISQLVTNKEEMKNEHEKIKDEIAQERDTAVSHLNNMEVAFNDVHAKYERVKSIVETLHSNEKLLKDSLEEHVKTIERQKANYNKLKHHASEKLQAANQEIANLVSSHQMETAKMNAVAKKAELKIKSLEEALEQKKNEVRELTQICDELIAQQEKHYSSNPRKANIRLSNFKETP